MLVRPTVEAYFQETTTTNVDNDTPTKQRFCIHRRSAPISKPLPGTYVSYVEDHQEDCRFFPSQMSFICHERWISSSNRCFTMRKSSICTAKSSKKPYWKSSKAKTTKPWVVVPYYQHSVLNLLRNKRSQEFLMLEVTTTQEYRSLAVAITNSIKSCPLGGNYVSNGFETSTIYQTNSLLMSNSPS